MLFVCLFSLVAGAGDSLGSVVGHGVHGLHDALWLAGGLRAEVLPLAAGAHEAGAAGAQVQCPLRPPDGVVQLTQFHTGAALYNVRASYGFSEWR